MTHRGVIALVVSLLLAAGCSQDSPAKRPKAPGRDASYADAPTLGKALQLASVGCTRYHEDTTHPDAQSQGHCVVRGVQVTIAVYASGREREDQVVRMRRTLRARSGSQWFVWGPNWTVNCHRFKEIAYLIEHQLGGTVEPVPEARATPS